LAQVRQALVTKYANLEWAVFDHETDLSKLFAETQTRIEKAGDDSEARAAFDRLADRLGDEHAGFSWPQANAATTPRCAALGYDERSRAKPLAANAAGYQPLHTPTPDEFPAGVITIGGRKIGILKIGVFMPQGYPALCEAAIAELGIPGDTPCDDACVDKVGAAVANRQTRDLIAVLQALRADGVAALVVDVAGNGGGTEWAEAVARMLTPIRLRSEGMRFVRGAHWEKTFADDERELRSYAAHAQAQDRTMLLALAREAEERRREALTPCDSAPLWRSKHLTCEWLGRGFYGSGLLAAADPNTLRGKPWADLLFSPTQYPYEEGVWRRPLIVLIDNGVASAASEFAAVLQDNRAAVIMGEPSGGGCGHTNGGTPTTLSHSRAVFNLPDCARFRTDGTNEARGIEPDVLVGFLPGDGPHLRAARFLANLPEAVARTESLSAKR
jgi:hypothetical protein